MQTVAGVILAGGKSSRMGEDKATLIRHGKTLLETMQVRLQEAGISTVYISRNDEIADRIPGHGPLSGVHAALHHTETRHSHLVFVPVDMPGLTPALLRQLAATSVQTPLVRFEHFALPFRLETQPAFQTIIETMLTEGNNVSLKALQNRLPLTELPLDPVQRTCFTNINTPQEWQDYYESSH